LAEEIARKLDALATTNPELVREGVDAYASRVQANNWMKLTRRPDERLIKSWMELVRSLEIKQLGFRYIGFTVAGKKGDLKEPFARLSTPVSPDVRWVKAPNQKNPGAVRDLAVDVAYESRGCGAVFRYVIAMAAIAQPWPTITVDSIQGSPAQEAVSGIPAAQGLICRECNTPMPARLPQRVAKKSDGESSSLNGPLLRHLYMQVTLNRSKHVWCCHFLEGGPKVALLGFRIFQNMTDVLAFTGYWKLDTKFVDEQMTVEGGVWLDFTEELYGMIGQLINMTNSCI
jgi:hypothetical protein